MLTFSSKSARPQCSSHAGKEVGSVGDEDRFAKSLPDGGSSVLQVELE